MSTITFTTSSGTNIAFTNIASPVTVDLAQSIASLLDRAEQAVNTGEESVLRAGIGSQLLGRGVLFAVWGDKEVFVRDIAPEGVSTTNSTPVQETAQGVQAQQQERVGTDLGSEEGFEDFGEDEEDTELSEAFDVVYARGFADATFLHIVDGYNPVPCPVHG